MNERIHKLAEQAGFYFYDMHDIDGEDCGESIEADSLDAAEKFAKLILAEVDDVIDNLYHALPLEQAAVLLTLDENIKERFYGDEE